VLSTLAASRRKNLTGVENVTHTPFDAPMNPSTGAGVRNRQNAVRNR
jgi:hypothetical protein